MKRQKAKAPEQAEEEEKLRSAAYFFEREIVGHVIRKAREGNRGWAKEYPWSELCAEIQQDAAWLQSRYASDVGAIRKTINIAARAMFLFYRADHIEEDMKTEKGCEERNREPST